MPKETLNLAANGRFKQLLKTVEKAFKQLHKAGKYNPEDIVKVKEYKALVDETSGIFRQGIQDNQIPQAMQESLNNDVYVFSGLKTHAQLLEASRQLLTEEGRIKPFSQFSKDISKIKEDYNRNYLEAEYQFAVTSAQMAGKWAKVSDRYNLQYRTANDDRVRQSHKALDRITLPKDDAFWLSYYPPNGWRCRCNAIEVSKTKYEQSDSGSASAAGEQATTEIGKDGKNRLEMFRFNPGAQKVVFPPSHPYTKVQGADKVKSDMQTIPLSNFIKGDLPTNTEIKNIFKAYADKFPDDFRNGLEEIKFQKSTSYMMQHSMAYQPRTMSWVGKSKITLSTHTFSSIDFNPAEELRAGLGAIKKGEPLTFKQEYAFESLWHEILHAKTQSPPQRLSQVEVKNMETINQFVARHTYNQFIERLGGKAAQQTEIIENGYGYSTWVKDFRNKLSSKGISEKDALEYFEPHLMTDYRSIGAKGNEFFNKY